MKKKHFLSIVLAALSLMCLIPSSFAAGIAPEKDCTLTVNFTDGSTPISGARFKLYYIADTSDLKTFDVKAPFDSYGFDFKLIKSSDWDALADKLKAAAIKDNLTPLDQGVTNSAGKVQFTGIKQETFTGLYLLVGEDTDIGYVRYMPQSLVLCLPGHENGVILKEEWDIAEGWTYDVTVSPKFDKGSTDDKMDLVVTKLWQDEDSEERPGAISITVKRDGNNWNYAVLSEENGWTYTWTDIPKCSDRGREYQYDVIEDVVPEGYVLEKTKKTMGKTTYFVLENRLGSIVTPEPEPQPTPPPAALAQTGQLWWPVPVLAGLGILCAMIGYARRRAHRNDNDGNA